MKRRETRVVDGIEALSAISLIYSRHCDSTQKANACWLAYVSILEFCCCWLFFFSVSFPTLSSPWTWTGKKQQEEQQATHPPTHSSIHSPSPYVFALSLVPPAGTVELWGFRFVIMFGMWVFGLVFPELPSKRVLEQLSWLCSSLFSFACSSARLTFSPHVGGVHGAWVIVASHYHHHQQQQRLTSNDGAGGWR